MPIPTTDSIRQLPFPTDAQGAPAVKASKIEGQVIELFEQFRNPLLRYVISLGLSVHDGEEIIQEVFLALFRHLQLGKPDGNLRGWVFRVAHNLALKLRDINRRVQAITEPDETLAERQPALTPNPERQAASKQRLERMQAILRVLPEQDRYCLYLRAEGLRYREIAAALGISLGAVSLAISRSLARLERAEQG